ncbi:MAG: GNAT family N-acetyltransferase [Waddliaceae bacterium]|nr:GNAT family N-acetyltransferase [Waddliaceae bacterium]MBT3579671.1 GNAT family N-acetyltransferase [Waddliaceae bacterium]MBT4445256.1 GNAT family N-acetyltransferase [Waddliaceae bacterium]MBT6928084.1 GNAT family N-acetyltransferase [Waddliaceae bacterium]MBT7264645.1 GNAT family N-acetyltransferase [Waddliaceae bacterium]
MYEEETKDIEGLEIRYTVMEDAEYLKEWLCEPGMLRWFPMVLEREVDDSVHRWVSFSNWKCALTVVLDGKPCGLGALYLMPYKKIAHQCEWGLILSTEYQSKGIGTALTKALEKLAKEKFKIELLHLQVYEGNTKGRAFFTKMGYKEFGRQTHWIKEGKDVYRGRIFMEKFI